MRRPVRSLSRIQELPVEVVERICAKLDVSDLASLRRSSKAWKQIVDSKGVLGPRCIQEGILSHSSQTLEKLNTPSRSAETTTLDERSDGHLLSTLRQTGYSVEELSFHWSLLGAKKLRSRGLPFRNKDRPVYDVALPTTRRQYQFPAPPSSPSDVDSEDEDYYPQEDGHYLVRTFKIDHVDRVIISAHLWEEGGLRVTCIETGKLLWFEAMVCYKMEISEGWVVTSGNTLTDVLVWRFDRLTRIDGAKKRGVLHKQGSISSSRKMMTYCFKFPHLVSLTEDLHVVVFDVRNHSVVHDVDVKPQGIPEYCSEGRWHPRYVEFDDEYYFVLTGWNETPSSSDKTLLQVFSRETGLFVGSLYRRQLSDHCKRTNCAFDDIREHVQLDPIARWDQSGKPYRWPGPPAGAVITCQADLEEYFDVTYPCFPFRMTFSAVKHDEQTGSLCLLSATSVVVLSDYKARLKSDQLLGCGSDTFNQPIILSFPSEEWESEKRPCTTLAVGSGFICFNVERAMIIVDLRKVLSSGQAKGSLSRFKLPIIRVPDGWGPREHDDCRAIHLDQTLLAFEETLPYTGDFDYEDEEVDGPNVITLLDFAELGRMQMDKTLSIKEKHRINEVESKSW